MSHPPFMIIPQNATPYYPTGATPLLPAIRTPLLLQTPLAPSSNNNGSAPTAPSVTSKQNPQPAFKAPAHKHAHHLHSIPPREKSTRTLIIDHLLWVHSRTRFAQARAELGMTDRTGGSSSPNYVHRERPENFEEEDEAASDSECVSVLRHRSGWSMDNEDARLAIKDPLLAKALRTRSESVEKVVASMLHQPPEVQPLHPDDTASSPGSPEPKKQTPVGTNSHPHTLPNGVRLRAALATLINDFFARESHPPSTQALNTYLPSGIVPLLPISSLISEIPSSISVSHFDDIIGGESNVISGKHANHFARQHRHPPATTSAQTHALYAAGIDPSASPAPRCSRHLYTACTICLPPPGTGPASRRPVVTSFPVGHPNTVTGWQDGSGIGSGLSSGPKKDDSLLRRKHHGSTNLVDLIQRFLKLSALVAMELGLEADEQGSVGAPQWNASDMQSQSPSPPKGKGRGNYDHRTPSPAQQQNNPSPKGSESASDSGEKIQMQLYALRPSSEWYGLCAGLLTRAVLEGYVCGGWKGLGALETLMKVGLGLRPDVLNIPTEDTPNPLVDGHREGSTQQYDHHNHHYHQHHHSHHHSYHHDNSYEEFDPDDFPTITESAKVLFPSLRQRATSFDSLGLMEQPLQVVKEAPEQEYEYDMEERLSRVRGRFYQPDVSVSVLTLVI